MTPWRIAAILLAAIFAVIVTVQLAQARPFNEQNVAAWLDAPLPVRDEGAST